MNFIEMFLDSIPRDTCEEIIARFEADPEKEPSRTARRVNPAVRTGTMLIPGDRPDWQEVTELVETAIRGRLAQYVEKYQSLRILARPEKSFLSGPVIERIEPGQSYEYHIDAGPANTGNRILSILIYLRDIDEGGFTEFPYQSLRTVPRAGALLLFPPFWTHLHRGVTPTSQIKYNISNYLVVRAEPVSMAVPGPAAASEPDVVPWPGGARSAASSSS